MLDLAEKGMKRIKLGLDVRNIIENQEDLINFMH